MQTSQRFHVFIRIARRFPPSRTRICDQNLAIVDESCGDASHKGRLAGSRWPYHEQCGQSAGMTLDWFDEMLEDGILKVNGLLTFQELDFRVLAVDDVAPFRGAGHVKLAL